MQLNDITRRRFVQALGLVGAGAAASAALSACGSGDEKPVGDSNDGGDTTALMVDSDFATMTWDEILAEAKGQTVTFLAWGSGGADAYVQKFWQDLAGYMKTDYDIDLQYAEYDQAEYEKISTDLDNGADATYDLFWMTGAANAPIREAGGAFGERHVEKLPNNRYLNYDNNYVTFDGVASTDFEETPFQNVNPSLVYSTDSWTHEVAWDETDGAKGGLFHDFSELAKWVKKYPGKFTYMDLTGAGSFHGQLLVKAILSELTSDGQGGWKPVYDEADSAAARRTKIQKNLDGWYDWSISSEASEEAFYAKADYVWAFLNELKPNLLQGDAGPLYCATAPDMMAYVNSGDLAVTFTTCTSISERVKTTPDAYMANPAIYMLQTSIGYWDYLIIMSNSVHKAGALVVANALLDPKLQAEAFVTTGNGYTVDYELLDAEQKAVFDDAIAAMGTLSPSTEDIAQRSYIDKYGTVVKWLTSGWDQYVNKAS
jgi:ABC-type uncharacterized transport system YnjBCD substrate-binding protein